MNMGQDRQMQMVGGNGGNQFRQYAGQNTKNLAGYNDVIGNQGNANQNQIGNGNLVAARAEGNAAGQNGNQIRCYNCRGIADLDDIEEVNANCILMANLQQASTSDTQSDSTPIYDTDGSADVHKHYDNNEIFNMFTQEEKYTELLEPIPELHQVPQNDNDVVSEVTGVEQGGETVEQHPNYMQQPMPNPEDITDSTTTMNMALALMAKAFKLNYSTPTNNNQRISSNPRNRQIAQPGMNMGQDRQMQMVGGNGGNQFRQYAGNLNGYNAV
nr:hypothetical protein [Tanacetum cinerariifolium]